jgi:acyl-coenzyme A thioesterase PaaI-like protein
MQKEKKENSKEIDIVEALSEIHEVTPEHLANRMLDHEKPYTHTEIHNPISMTALDTLASYLKDLELNDIISEFSFWLRVNFIAYMRKRASEMVEIIKGLKEKEQEKPTLSEVMLGR